MQYKICEYGELIIFNKDKCKIFYITRHGRWGKTDYDKSGGIIFHEFDSGDWYDFDGNQIMDRGYGKAYLNKDYKEN